MKPAMYIFVNRGLDMSAGKIAAQAGHAATEAALLSCPESAAVQPTQINDWEQLRTLWDSWRTGLHYAKYVMEARNNEHIRDIDFYLRERGFRTKLIIDEGHTEVPPISPTALGVALVDKHDPHTDASFSSFKLYRDLRPSEVLVEIDEAYLKGLAEGKKQGYDLGFSDAAAIADSDRMWSSQ